MVSFCHHCGQTLDGQGPAGQTITCRHCGRVIDTVAAPPPPVVDQTEERIRGGTAARCPQCGQAVEVKATGAARALVPHFAAGQRKMCPGSGKPVAPAAPPPPPAPLPRPAGVKDFSALMTRDFIKVVSCRPDGPARVEELTLEYLDKKDRVRLQIEALRDVLGPDFRLKSYPEPLQRPNLAVWGNAGGCVIARKHDQGGYQPMTEEELRQILEDAAQHRPLFFQ